MSHMTHEPIRLEITFTIHQISEHWFADVPRERLLELVKPNGFTEADLTENNSERYGNLRVCAREDLHEINRVHFWRKHDDLSITQFVNERVGITLNSLSRVQEIIRHF